MKIKKRGTKKDEKESKIYSIVLIGSVLIIAGLLIFSNWKISQKRKNLTAKIGDLKNEIEFLGKKNEELKTGISQTQEDSYWEAKLRGQGYKKPGETVVVVKKEEEEGAKTESQSQNFWEKLIEGMREMIE